MKDPLVRTALFIKASHMKQLQFLSKQTDAPIAALIRRALDMYLDSRAPELKEMKKS